MGTLLSQHVHQYFKNAENMLKRNDFACFMENIGVSIFLSKDDPQIFSKMNFLKIQGLYHFNQYSKIAKTAPVILEHIIDQDSSYLATKYYGISLGYVGELGQSKRVFKDLLAGLSEDQFIWETYLNIAWVNLAFYKINDPNSSLLEAKEYLDRAKEHFDKFSDPLKRIYSNNLSVYHYYSGDYDQGIEVLEEAIAYCEEKDLPKIYNNLAEFHLKADEDLGGELISSKIKEYASEVEVIGTKYGDDFEMAKAFYTTALTELREDQLFTALDTLYLAFEYFKKAEAYTYAFDCLLKINEIVSDYKIERLSSLKDSLKAKLKDTPFYKKL